MGGLRVLRWSAVLETGPQLVSFTKLRRSSPVKLFLRSVASFRKFLVGGWRRWRIRLRTGEGTGIGAGTGHLKGVTISVILVICWTRVDKRGEKQENTRRKQTQGGKRLTGQGERPEETGKEARERDRDWQWGSTGGTREGTGSGERQGSDGDWYGGAASDREAVARRRKRRNRTKSWEEQEREGVTEKWKSHEVHDT